MTQPQPALIELMARAYYESSRSNAFSLPEWERCLDHWRVACRRDMAAALEAGVAAGLITVKAETT